jgi:hypothetical protein
MIPGIFRQIVERPDHLLKGRMEPAMNIFDYFFGGFGIVGVRTEVSCSDPLHPGFAIFDQAVSEAGI